MMIPVYEEPAAEHAAEVAATGRDASNANVNNGNNQHEIMLDPARLDLDDGADDGASTSAKHDDLSVFSRRPGSIKKLSYIKTDEEEDKDLASETYVYDGKPRSRFGLGRSKKM